MAQRWLWIFGEGDGLGYDARDKQLFPNIHPGTPPREGGRIAFARVDGWMGTPPRPDDAAALRAWQRKALEPEMLSLLHSEGAPIERWLESGFMHRLLQDIEPGARPAVKLQAEELVRRADVILNPPQPEDPSPPVIVAHGGDIAAVDTTAAMPGPAETSRPDVPGPQDKPLRPARKSGAKRS